MPGNNNDIGEVCSNLYNVSKRCEAALSLQGIYNRNFDIFFVKVSSQLSLREKRHQTSLLNLKPLATEISATLEVPAVVATRPASKMLDVYCNLIVNLLAPRRNTLEAVKELRLYLLVILDNPFHGIGKGEVELVHHNRKDVVAIISRRLLLVVRGDILRT